MGVWRPLLILTTALAVVHSQNLDCNFDNGFCSWKQSIRDNTNWRLETKETSTKETGPTSDHTGGGKYAYLETSFGSAGHKAVLISPAITVGAKKACLKFWYHMYGPHVSNLNVYGANNTLIWNRNGNQKNVWKEAEVDVPAGSVFSINIVGVKGDGKQGDLAIDDVTFTNNGSCRGSPDSSDLDCDFEKTCKWLSTFSSRYVSWRIIEVSRISDAGSNGPPADHSLGTDDGHILHLPRNAVRKPNEYAAYISPLLAAPGKGNCLTFWYRMFGPAINSLQVIASNGNITNIHWQRSGTQGPDWKEARVSIQGSSKYQLWIVGLRGVNYAGSTDIDDIKFSTQQCTEPTFSFNNDCDFEVGSCGFTQSTGDDFNWTRNAGFSGTTATGVSKDHSTGSDFGHYMFIDASRKQTGAKALMTSLPLTIPSASCLSFFYHMYGSDMGKLQVNQRDGFQMKPIWQRQGDQGKMWVRAEAPVSQTSNTSSSISFVGTVGSSRFSDIVIDDIRLRRGSCKSPGSCNFEQDTCTWNNVLPSEKMDNFDWVRGTGETPSYFTGPTKDSTLGTAAGHYMYIESSNPQNTGDKALLESTSFTGGEVRCLHFQYIMSGPQIGTLNIWLKSGTAKGKGTRVWSQSGDQRNSWLPGRVKLSSSSSFKIYIEGVIGGHLGDIAIDDMMVTNEDCTITPKLALPSLQTTRAPTTTPAFTGTTLPTPRSVIVFEKTPEEVKAPFTPSMTMRCSLKDTAPSPYDVFDIGKRDVSETQENIRLVNSIVVLRNHTHEHVAMVAANNPPQAMADFENIQVDGDVDGNANEHGYINLTWKNPTSELSGNYVCEINAMDNMGHTVVFTTSMEVTIKTPGIEDLVKYIHVLDEERKQTRQHIEQLTTTLHYEKNRTRHHIEQLTTELHDEQNKTRQLTTALYDSEGHTKYQLEHLKEDLDKETHNRRGEAELLLVNITGKIDHRSSITTREIDDIKNDVLTGSNLTKQLRSELKFEKILTRKMTKEIDQLTNDMQTRKTAMNSMQKKIDSLSRAVWS